MLQTIGVVGNVGYDIIHAQGEIKEQIGGSAAYSAIAINLFPFKVVIFSRIGRDYPVKYLTQLKYLGISTRYIKQLIGKSAQFEIEYDSNNSAKYIKLDLGVTRYINEKDIKFPKNIKAFHLSPLEPKKQLSMLTKIKENSNISVSVNTHLCWINQKNKPLFKKIINQADFFIINEEEAMLLTKTKRADIAIEELAKRQGNIIVTLGSMGSAIISEKDYLFVASLRNPNIVDPTGSGDAFSGAFLASYLLEKNIYKAAGAASVIAGIKTEGWGFETLKDLKFSNLKNVWSYVFSTKSELDQSQTALVDFLKEGRKL